MSSIKITDYKAVTADSIGALNIEVNDLLIQGYQPFGSICTGVAYNTDYEVNIYINSQAMVKYENT